MDTELQGHESIVIAAARHNLRLQLPSCAPSFQELLATFQIVSEAVFMERCISYLTGSTTFLVQ